jgi:hypothetical protein
VGDVALGLMWLDKRLTCGRDREARHVWRVTVGSFFGWHVEARPASDDRDFYAVESGSGRSM